MSSVVCLHAHRDSLCRTSRRTRQWTSKSLLGACFIWKEGCIYRMFMSETFARTGVGMCAIMVILCRSGARVVRRTGAAPAVSLCMLWWRLLRSVQTTFISTACIVMFEPVKAAPMPSFDVYLCSRICNSARAHTYDAGCTTAGPQQ